MVLQDAIREFSIRSSKELLIQCVPELKNNENKDIYIALLIMKMFEKNNLDLRAELGNCYQDGIGVFENIEKALSLFISAENGGSQLALYYLGWYYYGEHDYIRAIEYFSKCIAKMDEFTEHQLSNCYACLGDSYTKLSEPNFSKAIENLVIAAEKYQRGYACMRLGNIFGDKNTKSFNVERAIKYLNLGVSYGDCSSAEILGSIYLYGQSELEIEKNIKKAEEILLRFADSNSFYILRYLGDLYGDGDPDNGIEPDFQKAKGFYESAWNIRKDPDVASDLGYVYYRLDEYTESEKMLLFADENNNCSKSDFLGRMYKDGNLEKVDFERALYYYDKTYKLALLNNMFTLIEYIELLELTDNYLRAYDVAVEGIERYQDVIFAYYQSKFVLNGRVTDKISLSEAAGLMEICIKYEIHEEEVHMILGSYYMTSREYRKAERHYLDAFSLGNIDAAISLARLYEFGGGSIQIDLKKSLDWYRKAANAGSQIAKEEVACFKTGFFGGLQKLRRG